ncbi:hypothetical protein [Cytobacillus praedii]|uniref:hypothetical protein n=1 Tax=Cytobacillus praedii TaxID=1742358 RepID=UPI002E1D47C9|nr:hypothetical protein [Cytobacillus praedii]
MSFICEVDKARYIRTIDNVIQAKILLEKRGLYPSEEMEFYTYTNQYFISSDDGLDLFLKNLELGTGWVASDETAINDYGGEVRIIHVPELRILFDLRSNFTEKQDMYFNTILQDMSSFYEDEIGYMEVRLIFGIDGNVALYSDYFSAGMSGFLEKLLDFQDELKHLIIEINTQRTVKGEAA